MYARSLALCQEHVNLWGPMDNIEVNLDLKNLDLGTWIDVRSPCEFSHGHVPGALNIPLFLDHERQVVGTTYKQQSAYEAMRVGLSFVIDRLPEIQSTLQKISDEKPMMIYCARGGMRSEYMTRLAHALGKKATQSPGGYKNFRQWVLQNFEKKYSLKRLGGFTGSGKTQMLIDAKAQGGFALDLEDLAQHKGSIFGGFGRSVSWGSEMFENRLAIELHALASRGSQPIWVEDESHLIGPCKIPDAFYLQMKQAPLWVVERTQEQRLKRLLMEYPLVSLDQILQASHHLAKRLGAERLRKIQMAVERGDKEAAACEWLSYYDVLYARLLEKQNYQVLESGNLVAIGQAHDF